MKLSDYAKAKGVRYETAWRWFRDGQLKGRRFGRTIIVEEEENHEQRKWQRVAIYARVSEAENKSNLESQAERLIAYCTAKGYQVAQVVKEVGSGVNESRPKFLGLLADQSIHLIVIEHKDRGTRFGFRYIETLLAGQGREIEVVNQAESGTEELLADLVSIMYSFCTRLYGQRRAKRKTEKIVAELEQGEDDATGREACDQQN
jgi:putative resolvase